VLRALGIPLLALKGLASLHLYSDLGLRPMADVDLLVPPDRAARGIDALLADGFRLKYGKRRSDLSSLMATRHGFTLVKDAEIDIHWSSLVEDRSAGADRGFWERAVPRTLFGREMLVPSPADLLLHTCVHGARFARSMSVAWVPDSARIIERHGSELDWSLLAREARRRVLELPLRETLRFLKEELESPVPDAVLQALEPREPAWLFWLDHQLFAGDPSASTLWHRAAARIVDRLRHGIPLPENLVAPVATRARGVWRATPE
jgi:hypothetical protein